ncbi:UDP-2,3-diacylglucosamine diphosphatase [Mucilaginibacter koreensis]
MPERNQIYFASDFHLGAPNAAMSQAREARLVRWLDMIKADAAEVFLMGDVFDFWFEYKTVVPKGYIRFLGKLAELADSGIQLYFFRGNHDMWMRDYFEKELKAKIISNELTIERGGKTFYLHHGDGLGPGDNGYKLLKKLFRSKTCQWLLSRIHPNLTMGVANYWSGHSRVVNETKEKKKASEQEWLVTYCNEVLQQQTFDYLIFGHRHIPMQVQLNTRSRYINLGEWIVHNSYAVFDGTDVQLRYFEQPST